MLPQSLIGRRVRVRVARRVFEQTTSIKVACTRRLGTQSDSATPRSKLQNWYDSQIKPSPDIESTFKIEDHFHEGKILWTASFTCPIDKQVYRAGALSDEDFYDKWQWSSGERRVPLQVDGKLYYQRLKTALHAAAGRRLDSLENKAHFCKELTSHPDATQLAGPETDNKLTDDMESGLSTLANSGAEDASTGSEELLETEQTHPPQDQPHFDPSKLDKLNMDHARSGFPKATLTNYYSALEAKLSSTDFQTFMHNDVDGKTWWSAKFVCPLSGKEYISGTLDILSTTGAPFDIRYKESTPYYPRSKDAINAAAAKAVDEIYYVLARTTINRLCRDDPGRPDQGFVHPDAESLQLTLSKQESPPVGVTLLDQEQPDTEVDTEVDDLKVFTPSGSGGTTLDRIMSAWSGNITEPVAYSNNYINLPALRSPEQIRTQILADAESFLASMDPVPASMPSNTQPFVAFSHSLNISSATACGFVLNALGKANQIRNGQDVQRIADKAWKQLSDMQVPDVKAYNAYMLCLAGTTVGKAEEAQNMLEEMIDARQRKIPSPDIDSYKNALKLWAYTGNVKRSEEAFELLSSTSGSPDRESFILLLSSLAYGSFDYKTADRWINDMKVAGLSVDGDVLEAPLWSFAKSSGNGRRTVDKYDEIFSSGYIKSPSKTISTEVKEVENWVTNVPKSGMFLTIKCYEAVVQSLVRTGSKDDVDRAESWALKTLSASFGREKTKPSVRTFYPILAARAFAGEDLSKVKALVHKLAQSGNRNRLVRPDGRVYSLLFLAYRKKLELRSSEDNVRPIDTCQEQLDALSKVCDELIATSNDGQELPFVMEIGSFWNVLRSIELSCSYAGDENSQIENAELAGFTDAVINKYLAVTRTLFDVEMKDLPSEDDETYYPELSHLRLQFGHLAAGSPLICLQGIKTLNVIFNAGTSPEEGRLFLLRTEWMMRSLVELRQRMQLLRIEDDVPEIRYLDSPELATFPVENENSTIVLCTYVLDMLLQSNREIACKIPVLEVMLDLLITRDTRLPIASVKGLLLRMIETIRLSGMSSTETELVLGRFLSNLFDRLIVSGVPINMDGLMKASKSALGAEDRSRKTQKTKVTFVEDPADESSRAQAISKSA